METNCNIPDDLVSEILSWLSVRQLLRFRSVSKSWCAIIDNPRFISKHHDRRYAILKEQGEVPIFFNCMGRAASLLLELASLEDAATQLYFLTKRYGDVHLLELNGFSDPESHQKYNDFADLQFIGCAKGVFLFKWGIVSVYPYLGLWNPATREFKVVPRVPRSCREYMCGLSTLGFDPKSNDIKIIRHIFRISNKTSIYYCYELYSLKTDSWKSIEYPSHLEHNLSVGPDADFGVSINNIHYWTCTNGLLKREKSNFILSFDFCNEIFEFLSLPCVEGQYRCSLGNYNGSLAFICYQEKSVPVKIWVMTKVDGGIPSAWQHLFSIGPFREDYVTFCSFRVGGDMLLRLRGYPRPLNRRSMYLDDGDDDDGCLYDPTTEMIIARFGFGLYYYCFEYVESLLKLTNRI